MVHERSSDECGSPPLISISFSSSRGEDERLPLTGDSDVDTRREGSFTAGDDDVDTQLLDKTTVSKKLSFLSFLFVLLLFIDTADFS